MKITPEEVQLRDRIATTVLPRIMAAGESYDVLDERLALEVVRLAYRWADLMLRVRREKKR